MTKPPPSYSPVYAAALYPELAVVFRDHGYALAVHGSLQRDFDLVAIPWIELPSPPSDVVKQVTTDWAIVQLGEPTAKLHGRTAYTLSIGHGQCSIDLSFMPLENCLKGGSERSRICRDFTRGFADSVGLRPRRMSESDHWLAGYDAGYRCRVARNEALDKYLVSIGQEPQAVIRPCTAPNKETDA